MHHLDENLGGDAVRLTAAELAEIRTALAQIRVQGVRSPESALHDQ